MVWHAAYCNNVNEYFAVCVSLFLNLLLRSRFPNDSCDNYSKLGDVFVNLFVYL